jgi:hypothetical protein
MTNSKPRAVRGIALRTFEKVLDLKLTLTFSMRGWDVAILFWRKAMKHKKEYLAAAATAVTLFAGSGGAVGLTGRSTQESGKADRQMTTTQSKFFCNIKALTPEERSHLKQLGEKLTAARKEVVEMEKGYEFQFSPPNATLAELAEWVAMESKCCPFFDFHIDLENEGQLLCLRLTGEGGIKQFIRAEFHVQ